MNETVYVVDARRTPFGSFGGQLSDMPAPELAATVMRCMLTEAGLEGEQVSQVIIGQVLTGGAGQAPARQAMRAAEVPDSVPALTVNKVCGSGLKAIMLGADAIRLGDSSLVMAGGMENMSMSPYALPSMRFGARMGAVQSVDLMLHDALIDPYSGRHMGLVTEELIKHHRISRQEQDKYAICSYERSQSATRDGRFFEEMVPILKAVRKGEKLISDDEEPFKVVFEKIEGLKPVFSKEGTITAANASTINDGAAMALLADEDSVQRHALQPLGRLVAYTTFSTHPDRFAEAPIGAIERACALAGLKTGDIDLFEVNEAFSAVPLMVMKSLGIDLAKMNVNGGAVSIGHPVGASGARIAGTLLHEMKREGLRYGLTTLCIGGGEAVAAIFERV